MFGFFSIITEIYIIIQVLFLLILGVILNNRIFKSKYKLNITTMMHSLSCLVLFYAFCILYNSMYYENILLNYQLIFDNLAFFFKFIVLGTSFISILYSSKYCEYENIKTFEYILLLLLSVVGILTIISCYDLMTMYLAIELQSLCFYIVTNLKFYSNFSVEAGLKYFILGSVSSCVLLFGSSLLYGLTGLTNFLDLTILFYYHNFSGFDIFYYKGILLSIILLYCGILFKVGVVPFHLWLSDIYEGAPTNITLFFAIVPQIGIISLLLRLNIIFMYSYLKELHILFLGLSILSIIIGTLGAIYQIKLKRILAYSSISNIGYILSILLTTRIENMYSVILYIIIYNIVSLGLWLSLLTFRNQSNLNKFKNIGELSLLFRSNRYLSILFTIFLFSAMGIPPMLGFFSKFFLLLNIIELKMYFYLIFLIIFNSIGVIYYLNFIKIMFSNLSEKSVLLIDIGSLKACFLIFLMYLNVFFFFYPNYVLILIHNILIYLFI